MGGYIIKGRVKGEFLGVQSCPIVATWLRPYSFARVTKVTSPHQEPKVLQTGKSLNGLLAHISG